MHAPRAQAMHQSSVSMGAVGDRHPVSLSTAKYLCGVDPKSTLAIISALLTPPGCGVQCQGCPELRGTVSKGQGTHATLRVWTEREAGCPASWKRGGHSTHPWPLGLTLLPPSRQASLEALRCCLSHAALGAAQTGARFRNSCLEQPGLRGPLLLMVKY